jgi:cytidyltransferase-like protein
MSGISHLQDLYHKKGNEFINKLFQSFVTVNEKMDGSAFTFERDSDTGKFKFYKRDQRNPITLVDRTLMKYYEKPIQYIESLPPHIIQNIPRGWRFGLEYFANPKPVEIAYDRVPKNNLILSYVHKAEGAKGRSTVQNQEDLNNWADLLGVERPPIIFQGVLSKEQKRKILEFINTPFSELVSEFKTKSFVAFIIGVLNPELKNTALNNDLEKAIEGIVFRFGSDEDEEPVLAKMVDPVFTELAKSKYVDRKENKPSDFLGITVLDVMNFILERGADSFKFTGKTEDERYLSYMSDVFVEFLDENSDRYKGMDFDEPGYLKQEDFRVNKKFVKNREALGYIEEDEAFESLFKLIVNQFRKIKKRAGGIISADVMEQFNSVVKDIETSISKSDKSKSLKESELPSFNDFKSKISKKVEYVTEENEEPDDVVAGDHQSFDNFISDLEYIDNKEKDVKNVAPLEEEDKKDLEPINIIVGRFQPFHKGHLSMARELKEKNNLPCLAVVIHPGHNKSGKSPFDVETVKKYMEAVVRENQDFIKGFVVVTRGLLGVIAGAIRKHGYTIELIGSGDDRTSDYEKQVEYLKKAGKEFPDRAKVVTTKRVTSGSDVRKRLKDENFTAFKKLVTPEVASLYSTLVSSVHGSAIKESESRPSESTSTDSGKDAKSGEDDHVNLNKGLEECREVIGILHESMNDLKVTDGDVLKYNKIKKFMGNIKGADTLFKMISGKDEVSEKVVNKLCEIVYGKRTNYSTDSKKYSEAENLFLSFRPETVETLHKRFVEGLDIDGSITFGEFVKRGIIPISEIEIFNGISSSDLFEIYNSDPSFSAGKRARGKGEALACIAFGGYVNPERESDVYIGDNLVEVKTTVNASIAGPETGVSQKLQDFVNLSYSLAEKHRDNEKSYGKNSFGYLLNEIRSGGEKAEIFWKEFGKITGFNTRNPEMIMPILVCHQVDHYSKERGFDNILIYKEQGDGSPESACVLSDGGFGFVNEKNVEILSDFNIYCRIYSKIVEIMTN